MKIREVRDSIVSLRSELRNAYISFTEMTVSIVAIVSDVLRAGRPVIGLGFHSAGRYEQQGVLRGRLIPRLLASGEEALLDGSGRFDPRRAWGVLMMNEKPGGHGERAVAVAAVDMALWDLAAKLEDKPLASLLAERFGRGRAAADVEVYAAGGYYYPGKDLGALQEEVRGYLAQGYRDVKIKIGGEPLASDIARIEAALELLGGDGSRLAVDANGRFDLDSALAYAAALAPYALKWYEEPGDPLEYELLARVAAVSGTPLATGENLFSMQDSRNLLRYGGLAPDRDYLQMDPALCYGLTEYLRILSMMEEEGWSPRRCVPHGGHQLALHVAAGLGLGGNEAYPGVFQPFSGFADAVPVEQGRVRIPDAPGIGIELKADLLREFRTLLA